MLTFTSEIYGTFVLGNVLPWGNIQADLVNRPGFQAEMLSVNLKYDDRIGFGEIPWPYTLIFIFGYSVILYLSKSLKKEIHDRGGHLFHDTSGSYKIRFQKDRQYIIFSIHYAADFVWRNLEETAQSIRTQWEFQSPVFYYGRSRITKKEAMEHLSMLMLPYHDALKEDFILDELARVILMDFLQDQESSFQPVYIGAAQYENFYIERDNLVAVALKTGSLSALLKYAGIQNIPLFRKRLHQLYNMNIREFITEIRMSHAMKMLTDPTISIKEISVKTGFASAFYFSRVFTNYFGLPPKSFHAKKDL